MKKELKSLEENPVLEIHRQSLWLTDKNMWIVKHQSMMSYVDSRLKNSRPFMRDWLLKWIDAEKNNYALIVGKMGTLHL